MFLAGLILYWRPIAYVKAFNSAAKVTGPLILQYPLYGGIMGLITSSGLATVIAGWFVGFSTIHTLPFWSFIASIIIFPLCTFRWRTLGCSSSNFRTCCTNIRIFTGINSYGHCLWWTGGKHDTTILGITSFGNCKARGKRYNGLLCVRAICWNDYFWCNIVNSRLKLRGIL